MLNANKRFGKKITTTVKKRDEPLTYNPSETVICSFDYAPKDYDKQLWFPDSEKDEDIFSSEEEEDQRYENKCKAKVNDAKLTTEKETKYGDDKIESDRRHYDETNNHNQTEGERRYRDNQETGDQHRINCVKNNNKEIDQEHECDARDSNDKIKPDKLEANEELISDSKIEIARKYGLDINEDKLEIEMRYERAKQNKKKVTVNHNKPEPIKKYKKEQYKEDMTDDDDEDDDSEMENFIEKLYKTEEDRNYFSDSENKNESLDYQNRNKTSPKSEFIEDSEGRIVRIKHKSNEKKYEDDKLLLNYLCNNVVLKNNVNDFNYLDGEKTVQFAFQNENRMKKPNPSPRPKEHRHTSKDKSIKMILKKTEYYNGPYETTDRTEVEIKQVIMDPLDKNYYEKTPHRANPENKKEKHTYKHQYKDKQSVISQMLLKKYQDDSSSHNKTEEEYETQRIIDEIKNKIYKRNKELSKENSIKDGYDEEQCLIDKLKQKIQSTETTNKQDKTIDNIDIEEKLRNLLLQKKIEAEKLKAQKESVKRRYQTNNWKADNALLDDDNNKLSNNESMTIYRKHKSNIDTHLSTPNEFSEILNQRYSRRESYSMFKNMRQNSSFFSSKRDPMPSKTRSQALSEDRFSKLDLEKQELLREKRRKQLLKHKQKLEDTNNIKKSTKFSTKMQKLLGEKNEEDIEESPLTKRILEAPEKQLFEIYGANFVQFMTLEKKEAWKEFQETLAKKAKNNNVKKPEVDEKVAPEKPSSNNPKPKEKENNTSIKSTKLPSPIKKELLDEQKGELKESNQHTKMGDKIVKNNNLPSPTKKVKVDDQKGELRDNRKVNREHAKENDKIVDNNNLPSPIKKETLNKQTGELRDNPNVNKEHTKKNDKTVDNNNENNNNTIPIALNVPKNVKKFKTEESTKTNKKQQEKESLKSETVTNNTIKSIKSSKTFVKTSMSNEIPNLNSHTTIEVENTEQEEPLPKYLEQNTIKESKTFVKTNSSIIKIEIQTEKVDHKENPEIVLQTPDDSNYDEVNYAQKEQCEASVTLESDIASSNSNKNLKTSISKEIQIRSSNVSNPERLSSVNSDTNQTDFKNISLKNIKNIEKKESHSNKTIESLNDKGEIVNNESIKDSNSISKEIYRKSSDYLNNEQEKSTLTSDSNNKMKEVKNAESKETQSIISIKPQKSIQKVPSKSSWEELNTKISKEIQTTSSDFLNHQSKRISTIASDSKQNELQNSKDDKIQAEIHKLNTSVSKEIQTKSSDFSSNRPEKIPKNALDSKQNELPNSRNEKNQTEIHKSNTSVSKESQAKSSDFSNSQPPRLSTISICCEHCSNNANHEENDLQKNSKTFVKTSVSITVQTGMSLHDTTEISIDNTEENITSEVSEDSNTTCKHFETENTQNTEPEQEIADVLSYDDDIIPTEEYLTPSVSPSESIIPEEQTHIKPNPDFLKLTATFIGTSKQGPTPTLDFKIKPCFKTKRPSVNFNSYNHQNYSQQNYGKLKNFKNQTLNLSKLPSRVNRLMNYMWYCDGTRYFENYMIEASKKCQSAFGDHINTNVSSMSKKPSFLQDILGNFSSSKMYKLKESICKSNGTDLKFDF